MSKVITKICGLRKAEEIKDAIDNGADFIGFVFYEKSPRNIDIEAAKQLRELISDNVKLVAVTVDPSDALLESLKEVNPDYIQLHGDESLDRVRQIKEKYNFKIIKAFRAASESDLDEVNEYEDIADFFLFDAKVDSGEYGGTGKVFDWKLLNSYNGALSYFLSGGISENNVAEAVQITGAKMVDISSGLESERGVKSLEKIISFLRKVSNL